MTVSDSFLFGGGRRGAKTETSFLNTHLIFQNFVMCNPVKFWKWSYFYHRWPRTTSEKKSDTKWIQVFQTHHSVIVSITCKNVNDASYFSHVYILSFPFQMTQEGFMIEMMTLRLFVRHCKFNMLCFPNAEEKTENKYMMIFSSKLSLLTSSLISN